MRSITAALSWEFFSYQTWTMTYMVAIANALPILCITALQRYNVDLDAKELAILPAAMTPFTIFILGLAVAVCQGPINRLYLKPLTNIQLVQSFFFPGLIATAGLLAGSIASWNLLFNLHWPILGPVLYGTAFWAAIFPSLRLPIKSPTRVFEAIVVGMALGAWCIRSGFGKQPTTSILQNHIYAVDVLIVIGLVVGSFALCVYRIGADRCNRTDSSVLAFIRRVTNAWDRAMRISSRPFSDKYRAQQWFDWKTFGLPIAAGLPVMLLIPIPVLLAMVAFGGKSFSEALTSHRNMLFSFVAIQMCLTGLWGFLAPHLRLGSGDISEQSELAKENQLGTNLSMGSFRATLPLSDQSLATILLRTILGANVSLGLMLGAIWLAQTALAEAFSAPIALTEAQNFKLALLMFLSPVASWTLMSLLCCLSLLNARNTWGSIAAFVGLLVAIAFVSWIHWLAATTVLILVVVAFGWITYRRRPSPKLLILSLVPAVPLILFARYASLGSGYENIALIYAAALGVAVVLPIHLMPLAIATYRRS